MSETIFYCLAVTRQRRHGNNAMAFDAKWTCLCDNSELGAVSGEGWKCVSVLRLKLVERERERERTLSVFSTFTLQ